jgi:hypothetical protein
MGSRWQFWPRLAAAPRTGAGMSSWQIHIPNTGPSAPLDVDAIEVAGRGLEGENRLVAQRILFDAATNPEMRTIDDLLTHLERIGQVGRRQLLNEVRHDLGLPTAETVDARRDNEARSRALAHLPRREMDGSTFTNCAADGCLEVPLSPQTGTPIPTRAKKWHCPAHEHLAEPGDMDDWSLRIRYSASGAIEYVDEVETERKRALHEEERARARSEQRRQERQAEAEDRKSSEAAMVEHFRPKSPAWDPLP